MNFLSFLIVITSGLLVCKFGLLLLEYERNPLPPTCVCFCSDATMISPQLTSRVEYRGPRQTTCECPDFLVPKLRQYMSFATPNGTCQVCRCEEDALRQKECFDLNLTVDVFLYTVIATTLLMAVTSTLRHYCCCSEDRRSSRSSRNKYIHIGEHQIVRLTKEQKMRLLGREPRPLDDQMIAIKEHGGGNKTQYNTFLV